MISQSTNIAKILVVMALLAPLHAAWAAEAGRISAVEGKADIRRAGTGPAMTAKIDDPVYVNDVLRTKRLSRLEVKMVDGSLLKLSELTQISINKYSSTGEQPEGLIDATRGQMRAIVTETFSKRKESFRVSTPTALVGVQGTDFVMLVLANLTQIMVHKGIVSVKNRLETVPGEVALSAGQMTQVKSNQAPDAPQSMKGPEVQDGARDPALLPISPTPLEGGFPIVTPPKK